MKKLLLCLLSLSLIILFVGCSSDNKSSEKEVSGTFEGAKYYRIGFPDSANTNDVYAHRDFIESHFNIDDNNSFGVAMPNLNTANDDTLAISGYNIKGKNKAIIYAGAERDYFIFYDAKISSSFSDDLLLMMSNVGEYMPYSEGKKYIKKYMK